MHISVPIPFSNDWQRRARAATPTQHPQQYATPSSTVLAGRERKRPRGDRQRASLQTEKVKTPSRVPIKYVQPAYHPPGMNDMDFDFSFTTISVEAAPTSTSTASSASTFTATALPSFVTDANYNSAKMRLDDDLPDIPGWVIGLLTGALSFGFIVAVILYLANFPPYCAWLHHLHIPTRRRRRKGYTKVTSSSEDDSDAPGSRRGRHRKPLPLRDANGLGITTTRSPSDGGLSTRRRKNLSVDTRGRYGGLGFAYNPAPAARRSPRRRSYDEEKLRERETAPMSPARFAWEAMTAPIPSLSGGRFEGMSPARFAWEAMTAPIPSLGGRFEALFGHAHTDARGPVRHGMLRYGGGGFRVPSLESGMSSTGVEREQYDTAAEVADLGTGRSNVFHRIGEGMEHAADRLGRMMSDVIDGQPEEGLLLPVRMEERERGYEPDLRSVI